MDEVNKNYPTRRLKPIVSPDGSTYWKSCTHGANIGGEICPERNIRSSLSC